VWKEPSTGICPVRSGAQFDRSSLPMERTVPDESPGQRPCALNGLFGTVGSWTLARCLRCRAGTTA
jgi:hypothetical protein